jgi:histidinol-phosphate aminotransferase
LPRLTDLASGLPASVPFVGPEALERGRGRRFAARLGANESVFGPSPRAVEAMARAAAGAWMYGDPENHELKAALAELHRLSPANVMVGAGIDGLLGDLVRLLVAPGTPVVACRCSYPTFAYHVTGFGGVLHEAPRRGDAADPEALAQVARSAGAALVYLANPDNPMGSWLPAGEVMALAAALPEGCLLCLDEAYADFAPPAALPRLDGSDGRIMRMRTFSKAHGLAGARIGYALGEPDLIAAFDRVRNHFGVSRIAQAGALAALADADWLADVVGRTSAARTRLARIARRHGLEPLPSATNFVTMDCGRDGSFARSLVRELGEGGIFVRMPFAAPQDRCIRVGAGSDRDLDLFEEALPGALARAGNG